MFETTTIVDIFSKKDRIITIKLICYLKKVNDPLREEQLYTQLR